MSFQEHILVPAGEQELRFVLGAGEASEIEYVIDLSEPDTKISLLFIVPLKARETLKVGLKVIHRAPRTESVTTVRSVHKRGSFLNLNANLHVSREALNSDALFEHAALLLANDARVRTIPSTECLNHQSTCDHKASIEVPNEGVVNYLLSRGFTRGKAISVVEKTFLT